MDRVITMKKKNAAFWGLLALSCVHAVVMMAFILKMPDRVPVQVGFDGNITNTASRWMYLILMLAPLFICISAVVIPKIDPNKDSFKTHAAPFKNTTLRMALLLIALGWAALPIANAGQPGYRYPAAQVGQALAGLVLVVAGNTLPKAQPNYFWGIKLPWTLHSPEIWHKTHRLGGLVFVLAGVLMMLSSLLPSPWVRSTIMFSSIAAITLIPLGYSLWLYAKQRVKQ